MYNLACRMFEASVEALALDRAPLVGEPAALKQVLVMDDEIMMLSQWLRAHWSHIILQILEIYHF